MRKNGFTLIELLTVIVVLAIIALIATPIVTKTIENSKKQSAIESVNNIIKTAEMYFVTATPNYGRLNLLDEKLSYNGQQPESGEIELNKDGDSRIYVYVSGYCVTKEYDSELYASKTSKEDCNWYATDNYETREGTTFTLNNQTVKNYLIYGNSVQNGTPTPDNPIEIESVGDLITSSNCTGYGSDACNNVGKYVIQVKSSGKNLFDTQNWYNWLRTFTTNYVKKTEIDGVSCIYYRPPGTYNKPYMQGQFKEKTQYTLSFRAKGIVGTGVSTGFYFKYTDGTSSIRSVANKDEWDSYTLLSTAGKTIDHIEMVYNYNQGCYIDENSIQLEESATETSYESYVEPKITNIYLDEPLRKIGEYADYIDYNNKKIVRNVKERVYTGKEYWYEDGTSSYVFDSTQPYLKNSKGSLLSNIAFYANKKNNNNFNFARSGAGYIEFNALNNGYTIETWKQYLVNRYNSGSPAKVQYDIATPIEQSIDLPNIETLNGVSTLSINTEIQPSNVKLTTSK